MGLTTLPIVRPKADASNRGLRLNPMAFGKDQDDACSDDSHRIIHEEGCQRAKPEKNQQEQLVCCPCPSEEPVSKMRQISALLQRPPYDEHAK